MNILLLVAATAGLVYLCRLAGFLLPMNRIPSFWEQFLRFVPISILTTLVVSSLYHESEWLGVKLVVLSLAGSLVWHTKQVGLSVLVGLGVLWLLMVVGGH